MIKNKIGMTVGGLMMVPIEHGAMVGFTSSFISSGGDHFKLAHFLLGKNIDNLTRQFVGSYRSGEKEVTLYVFNDTSWNSALYHIPSIFFFDMHYEVFNKKTNHLIQHFMWTEEL